MPFLLKPNCSCRASTCGGFAALERQAELGAGIGSLGLLAASVVRTLGLETLVFFVETHRWGNAFMKEWWEFIVNTNVCLKIIPLQCTRLLFSPALFVLWFLLPKVVVTPLASAGISTSFSSFMPMYKALSFVHPLAVKERALQTQYVFPEQWSWFRDFLLNISFWVSHFNFCLSQTSPECNDSSLREEIYCFGENHPLAKYLHRSVSE